MVVQVDDVHAAPEHVRRFRDEAIDLHDDLGRHLAGEFANAFIVSVDAPHASDLGAGRQWFSVRGITEENRVARVEAAMPAFATVVQHWQGVAGVGVEATALIGFSQGAIMALESSRARDALAGRVASIAGRFAVLPEQATPGTTLHLLHGKNDPVIPYVHTVAAAERLVALGADVTADVIPFVGHEINDEIAALLVERLKSYLPQRRWKEALAALPDADRCGAREGRARPRPSGDTAG